MARTLADFHCFGKHPSWRHLLNSSIQNFGNILWILFTMLPSIPSGPGHLFTLRFLMISSASWSVKFGSSCRLEVVASDASFLMFRCCSSSSAGSSSGKKLSKKALAVSVSVVVEPSFCVIVVEGYRRLYCCFLCFCVHLLRTYFALVPIRSIRRQVCLM
jgi:hypothetical protein